jgi:hypothetical protein
MAIKGIAVIDHIQLLNDQSVHVGFSLCNEGNMTVGLFTGNFDSDTVTALTLNTAVHDAAVSHLESQWGVEFNPLLDTIRIMNPVNLIGL